MENTIMFNFLSYLSDIIYKMFEGNKHLSASANNLYTTAYERTDITFITPYGQYILPKNEDNAFLSSVHDSSQGLVALGFLANLPTKAQELFPGDFLMANDSWALHWKSGTDNKLYCYTLDNRDITCTLPQGEWLGKYNHDIIQYLLSMINTLNSNINNLTNTFNTHMHTGVTTGSGTSGIVVSPLTQTHMPDSTTISQDKTSIENQEYLINSHAKQL